MSTFKEIIQLSLVSVPIILFVMLVRLFLKKAPKLFSYALWGIVLFRLLCPISFTSDFSFIGILERSSPSSEAYELPRASTEASPIYINNHLPGDYFKNTEAEAHTPAIQEKTSPLQPEDLAFCIWLAGLSVLLSYSLISYIRLKRTLVISVLLYDNIYIADNISSPFVIGVFKPKIYLPSNIPQHENGYIISHEQHHIKRKDHIIKLVAFLALCIHWFNPMVWIAFSLAVRDMEMSCDEAVLKKLGKSESANYSSTLLALSVSTRRFSPSPIAFGEGNTKMRIKNIMKYKKPKFFVIAAAIIICIATALFLVADPSPSAPASPFGATYNVSEITYHSNALSIVINIETAPKITLTSDNLIVITPNTDSVNSVTDTRSFGPVEKITLTKENFDNYFSHTSLTEFGWRTDSHTAQKIRKNNLNTWQFITDAKDNEGNGYYILQQKNGDIYFAVWSYNKEREQDPHSDDSFIHTLYQLTPVSEEAFPETIYYFTDAKRYIYPESIEAVMKPSVTISEENKTFHFTYSMFSSYLACGYYTEKNGKLIMDCGDGKIFTFKKTDNDTLIFMQNESSPIPKYRYSGDSYIGISPVPDGAEFKRMDLTDVIIKDPSSEENINNLEKAVSSAILSNYKSDKPDGLIHSEHHIILDTEEIHGLRTVEGTENITKKNVYAIVMHTSYSISDNVLNEVACDFSPAVIKFIVNSDSSLAFDEYYIPGEDGGFRKEVTNYFTEDSFQKALEYKKYRNEFSALCLDKANQILNGYTTDYSKTEELIKTICSSPAWASSPADYINEHLKEYEKLLKDENNTLGYCFSKFIAGGQTGLEGHIMAQACREIIEKRGEILRWDNYMTGQEWFDAFFKSAKELEEKYTSKELELMFPGTYVLLGTIYSH